MAKNETGKIAADILEGNPIRKPGNDTRLNI